MGWTLTQSERPLIGSPLARITVEMLRAFQAGFYYPALLVGLTIPEICSALKLGRETFIKEKHYVEFVEKYGKKLSVSGLDCYRLRGGLVHRGNLAGHPDMQFTHVLFSLPEPPFIGVHGINIRMGENNALCLDLRSFCFGMSDAVRLWELDHKKDAAVIKNMDSLISYGEFMFPCGTSNNQSRREQVQKRN